MIDLNGEVNYQDGAGNEFHLNTIVGEQDISGGSVPLSGYAVEGVGFGGVQPVGYTDPKATSDGIDTAEAYAGRRTLSMLMSVYGSTRVDLYQKIQDLLTVMRFMPRRYAATDGFRQLRFTMLTTNTSVFPSGEIPSYVLVRPLDMPTTEVTTAQTTGSDTRGYSARIMLNFLMKYPFKYGQELRVEEDLPIDGTNTVIQNHGGAPADAQLLIQSSDGTARAGDIYVTITVNGVPLKLKVAQTIGADGDLVRSILVDYKEQIVYIRELNTDTGIVESAIAQNLIVIDSGATFGTLEPKIDYPDGMNVSVNITDLAEDPVAEDYKVDFSWREAWY